VAWCSGLLEGLSDCTLLPENNTENKGYRIVLIFIFFCSLFVLIFHLLLASYTNQFIKLFLTPKSNFYSQKYVSARDY